MTTAGRPVGGRWPAIALVVGASVLAACTAPTATRATSAAGPTVPVTTTTAAVVTIFTAAISPVSAADLPASWRPGCPVPPEELRRLVLIYLGFDGQAHTGSLVVHASVSREIAEVFRRLYETRFAIRRMEPIDVFGGSDEASIAADNTSGFNCRGAVSSGAPHLSAHAYGRAVDLNPVENPYILEGTVLPPAGSPYLDRSVVRPGMAVRGGEAVAAFAAIGWSWGGRWASPDYQHFSESGN